MLLSEYTSDRNNNFNIIRFIAAFMVLYTHSFSLLSGDILDEPLRRAMDMSFGDIAVDVFFITSGFLITSSYLNRRNLIAFAWARILRIYPGLIAAMIFCVFVIGILFTNLTTAEYLSDSQTYKYFFKNIILFFNVEFNLPGVFQGLPFSSTVNGSLWTLPYEVRMYVILAFILTLVVFFKRKTKSITFKKVFLFIGLFSIFILLLNHFYTLREGSIFVENMIRLGSAFFVGAMFYIWKEHIVLTYKWFFVLLLVLVISSIDKDIFFIVYSLTLPYLIFFLAYVPKGVIRQFNKVGDYSYGMYIYAFPVQQSLIHLYPNISIIEMILYAFVITLILAILSWNFIEKKFLKMKNNYIFIENIFKR
ncbi:MAG: acyltransferase [Sulfurovum sp.]|nr:acyltransferase [Sulfurovum sp.]